DGEHWIAAPSMRERHRSRHHLAAARRQATTLDQLKAFSKFLDELGDLSKVITIVRITHDDKLAVCRLDPTPQRATISFVFDLNYAGSAINGDFLRTIRTPVVGDNDFSCDLILS